MIVSLILVLLWLIPFIFNERTLKFIFSIIFGIFLVFTFWLGYLNILEFGAILALVLSFPFITDKTKYSSLIFLTITGFVLFDNFIARFFFWEIGLISIFFLLKDNIENAYEFALFTQISSAFLLLFLISNQFSYLVIFLAIDQALFPFQFWLKDVYQNAQYEPIVLFSILSKVPSILLVNLSFNLNALIFFSLSAIISLLMAFYYLKNSKELIALLSSSSASFLDFIILINSKMSYLAIFSFISLFIAFLITLLNKEKSIEIPSLLYLGVPFSPIFFLFLFSLALILNYSLLVSLFILSLFLDVLIFSRIILQNRIKGNVEKNGLYLSIISTIIGILLILI
ncbi:MAG: hypothetical protein OH318_02755 [Candidatus Parvarchaeota archaeon]|nr:hypothetical protein [Candidatus Rehaiarchaeum fermentans]